MMNKYDDIWTVMMIYEWSWWYMNGNDDIWTMMIIYERWWLYMNGDDYIWSIMNITLGVMKNKQYNMILLKNNGVLYNFIEKNMDFWVVF